MPPIVDPEKCTGCKLCYENCPLDVFGYNDQLNQIVVLYPDECWHCGVCEIDCPSEAIDVQMPTTVNGILKQTIPSG